MGLLNLFRKKKRIRQFDKAFAIEELEYGVTSVQLYSNHEDFNNADSRQVQLSFREWMGYKSWQRHHNNLAALSRSSGVSISTPI